MPWCPQCGAEYREGITRCPKCGVALREEAPAPEVRPWRERLPSRLRWIVDDFARAPGYAAEAWRVLRRHPVLLVLPLAVAVFNAAERGTMTYVAFRDTAAGREIMARVPTGFDARATEVRLRSRDLFPLWTAVDRCAYPVPAVSPQGTLQLVGMVATREARNSIVLVAWVMNLLVVLPLAALVLSGYYGVVGNAVAEGAVSWRSFWGYVRRYFVRFYLFGVLLAVATGGLVEIALTRSATTGLYAAVTLVAEVITFALALTLVAVVAGEAALPRALRSGAAVVARSLPVAVFLLAMWVVALAFAAVLHYLIGLVLKASLPPVDIIALQPYLIPGNAVVDGLLAAIGAWLLIASFLWYRNRTATASLAPPSVGRCKETEH